jgi:hypothetical protein
MCVELLLLFLHKVCHGDDEITNLDHSVPVRWSVLIAFPTFGIAGAAAHIFTPAPYRRKESKLDVRPRHHLFVVPPGCNVNQEFNAVPKSAAATL